MVPEDAGLKGGEKGLRCEACRVATSRGQVMQARATSKIAVAGASADRVALSCHFHACGIWLTRPKVLHQTRPTGWSSLSGLPCIAYAVNSRNDAHCNLPRELSKPVTTALSARRFCPHPRFLRMQANWAEKGSMQGLFNEVHAASARVDLEDR